MSLWFYLYAFVSAPLSLNECTLVVQIRVCVCVSGHMGPWSCVCVLYVCEVAVPLGVPDCICVFVFFLCLCVCGCVLCLCLCLHVCVCACVCLLGVCVGLPWGAVSHGPEYVYLCVYVCVFPPGCPCLRWSVCELSMNPTPESPGEAGGDSLPVRLCVCDVCILPCECVYLCTSEEGSCRGDLPLGDPPGMGEKETICASLTRRLSLFCLCSFQPLVVPSQAGRMDGVKG